MARNVSAPGIVSRATRDSAGGSDSRGKAASNYVTAEVRSGMAKIAPSTATLYKRERDAEASTAGRKPSRNRGD